jgi:hypothetical protein
MPDSVHSEYIPLFPKEEEETTLTKITMPNNLEVFEDKFNKAYYKYWQAGNSELTGYSDGYVQALEDSSAAGMLEAFKVLVNDVDAWQGLVKSHRERIINAINKATK